MPSSAGAPSSPVHPPRLFCAILVLAAALPTAAWATPDEADEPESVGSEICEVCHDETVAAFRRSVHWLADPEGACEGCHGAGGRHIEEGDPSLIRRFGEDDPARDRAAACLGCHRQRARAGFERSDHALAQLACDDCHAPHGDQNRGLQIAETPGLCYGCHAPVRAQFALNERHPVPEGGVDCTDCHDPHDRSTRPLLGGFKQQACLGCHSEYRGPWFFEHEVVAVEGCGACHAPHGSVNRHLLTYQNVSDLCLQCHPVQPFFHDLTDPSGARNTSFNDCTSCHSSIHGSNSDALFLN